MIALDTSVVVRLVTADDPEQLAKARQTVAEADLWLCKTVLLETEWVLRYSYGLDRNVILATFRKLLGYDRLRVEERSSVLHALSWYEDGCDFADALHLASCGDSERFATFDRRLAKRAETLPNAPAVEPL